MSIYATLWELGFPDPDDPHGWPLRVWAQAVPAHIGHPDQYPNGDPYADFLPPAITDGNAEDGRIRAVVFVSESTDQGTDRSGQEYVEPLLELTGDEYAAITFDDLHTQLCERLHETGAHRG